MTQEITFSNNCTPYVTNDYSERLPPCQCPVCGGFLPADIFQDPLICKKCGSELIAVEASEKMKKSDDWDGEEGRICVVTKRTKTKLQTRANVERLLEKLVVSVSGLSAHLEKLANRPVYSKGKVAPKECHVDGGIKWFWTNESHVYEKALDSENSGSKEYIALKKLVDDAVAAGKTGVFVGNDWHQIDKFKKDGIIRRKKQEGESK